MLNAGNITGNTASGNGGGIYSEGNTECYSTLHLANALITENTARQGGGLWFCATGKTKVYITEGAAIYDNTAEEPDAAGDDFVFTGSTSGEHVATLANRMLGGGAVKWYPDGSVYVIGSSMFPSTGDAPRFGEPGASTDAVTVVDSSDNLALKAVVLDSAKSLAETEAKLVITENTASRGGGIGANGGIVIGTDEETTEITVEKRWQNDSVSDRPTTVTVDLLNGGVVIETVELTAENGWKHTFSELPVKNSEGEPYSYTVREHPVEGYTTQVTGDSQTGFVITNTKKPPDNPGSSSISVSVEKRWILDDGGQATESISVTLLRNGKEYDTVKLSEDNDWKYTWRGLSSYPTWEVVENDVPDGFVVIVEKIGISLSLQMMTSRTNRMSRTNRTNRTSRMSRTSRMNRTRRMSRIHRMSRTSRARRMNLLLRGTTCRRQAIRSS